MTYAINVTRQETADYVGARTQGFRVILTVTVLSGFVDAGLFRFRRLGQNVDFFEGVCSPADLQDWLLDLPDEEEGVLRHAVADLVYPSKDVAIDITDTILAELKVLCQEMEKLQVNLAAPSSVTIDSSAS